MNKDLKQFIDEIIIEGVGKPTPYGAMLISHEYQSDVDLSESDKKEAIKMLQDGGIDLFGHTFEISCRECETCREYDENRPYHVSLDVIE